MTPSSVPYPIASQGDLLRWEPQIDKILGELSLRQKVGQLHQLKIGLLNKPKSAPDEEKLIRGGMLGTAVFASGAYAGNERDAGTSWDATERYQRMAVDATGIPMLFARDVIHGHHTVYPIRGSGLGNHRGRPAFSRAVGGWGAEPGEFRVWVGTDSRNGIEGTLQLA